MAIGVAPPKTAAAPLGVRLAMAPQATGLDPDGARRPGRRIRFARQLRPWEPAVVATSTSATWATAAGVVAAMGSVLPIFLAGAVAVQLRDDLGLEPAQLGMAVGAFFGGAALSSRAAGRLAERLGARRAIRSGLVVTIVAELAVATIVDGVAPFVIALGVAGSSNSLTQVSINKLLAGQLPAERLGLGIAIKQSGMPGATLLGGAAVPLVAIRHGWTWTYAIAAAVATIALVMISLVEERAPVEPGDTPGTPDLDRSLLRRYALLGGFGAAAAGSITTFLVTGAEASGIDPGTAGWLLSIGSGLGIASRLRQGHLADLGRIVPVERMAWMLLGGGIGTLVFALHRPATYLLALAPAFALGWAWPGLSNLSVIRRNPSAPAAATGISQTGIYLGALGGPLVMGFVADRSFPLLWTVVAALLMASGLIARDLVGRLPTPTTGRG